MLRISIDDKRAWITDLCEGCERSSETKKSRRNGGNFVLFFFPLPEKEPKRSSAVPSCPPATLLASPLKELARWAQTAFSGPLGYEERGPGIEAKALATSQ